MRSLFDAYWDTLHNSGRIRRTFFMSIILHLMLLGAFTATLNAVWFQEPPKAVEMMVFAATDLDAEVLHAQGAPDVRQAPNPTNEPPVPVPPSEKPVPTPEPPVAEKPPEPAPPPPPKKEAEKPKPKPEEKKEVVAEKKPEPKPAEKPKPKEEPKPKQEPEPKKEQAKPKTPVKDATPKVLEPEDAILVEKAEMPVQTAGNASAVKVGPKSQGLALRPDFASWAGRVQRKVEPVWRRPGGIPLDPVLATVVVTFTVDRDGNLLAEPVAMTPQSDPRLITSAINAIKMAVPLPPLPASISENEITVEYTFTLSPGAAT